MTLRIFSPLFLCVALLPACDEGVDPGPDPEFRETTSCLKLGTSTTTIAVKTGIPDPDDPKGHNAIMLAPEQADEFITAYAQMNPDNEGLCTKVCESEKLDWTGDNCVANRDYSVGEYQEYEGHDGAKRFRVAVDTGKTEAGCACGY